jgi:hypothetical protein
LETIDFLSIYVVNPTQEVAIIVIAIFFIGFGFFWVVKG